MKLLRPSAAEIKCPYCSFVYFYLPARFADRAHAPQLLGIGLSAHLHDAHGFIPPSGDPS